LEVLVMLQRISLCTADGSELFSGVSLLRSEPPPPPVPALADDVDEDEDSSVRTPASTAELLAQKSRPSNDNARAESQSGLRAAVREDA
jgi:hypothetical protein